jgi:hypothetical protein
MWRKGLSKAATAVLRRRYFLMKSSVGKKTRRSFAGSDDIYHIHRDSAGQPERIPIKCPRALRTI